MTDLVTLGFKADTRGLTTAQRELDKTTAAGGRLDNQASKTEKTLGLVGAAIAALGVTASARQIIQYADSWSNLESQLKQVTSTQDELLDVQQKILALSKETRTSLSATGGLYASLARNAEDLKLSQEELLAVTGTMNKLFLVQGTSAEQAAGALFQLNQGLASGALRGDEFNSVAEGAPRVLDALSLSLGIAKGELREFAATGGITSEVLVTALQGYESTVERLASNVKATFAQNFQVANANITAFVGESEALTGVVDDLGEGLVTLSENIEATAYALGAGAAVLGASAIPQLVKYTAAAVSAGIANVTATKQVTGLSAALGVQAQRATIATVAARGLGAATRVMLGPIGLAITAVGAAAAAFDMASDSMDRATKEADEHANKMSRLHKVYAAMTKEQLGGAYLEAQKQAMALDKERAEISAQLQVAIEKERESNQRNADSRNKFTNQYSAEVAKLQEGLARLDEQIGLNQEQLDLINQVFEQGIVNVGEWNTATETSIGIGEKLAQSFADQLVSLENQRQKLILTSDEFEIYQARQDAIAKNYTPAMTKVIIDNIKSLQKQRKAIKNVNADLDELMEGDLFSFGDASEEADDFSSDLDSLISQVDNFGGAWTRTGNVIADSLGGAVSQLQDFANRMDSISDKQQQLNKLRGEYADGTEEAIKIDKALAKLDEESANAKISALGQTIGLSAQLFEENSKERKALHALEMGFMAAEIALAAEKAVTSAVSAIANQGSGDPYTAFGRIAAMVGIMTGVLGAAGIAFSGGSGGGGGSAPEPSGTGTVLGDSSAQSSSIANALDDFDDIQIDQLAELRGIRTALTGLSGGIQRLASQFSSGLDFGEGGYAGELGKSQNASGLVNLADKLGLSDVLGIFGDNIVGAVLGGLFGSTKKELVDSGIQFLSQTLGEILDSGQLDAELFQTIKTTKKKFFGLSKSTSTSKETSAIDAAITQQMADIFGFIGDSVIGAAESLGFDSIDVQETRITGVAEQVFGRMGELMGPIFETELITVEKDLRSALESFEVDLGDISFKDKTGEEIQAELEAIFSQQADLIAEYLVPSISDYQKVGEGAFETLQRVAYEQAIFNDAMNNLGIEFTNLSNVMKIDVAQSIIGLIGSAEEFSELTSSFFENFYSEAEQLSTLEQSISDVFDSLGISMVNSKEAFRDLVEGVDVTTEEGQQLLATLLELSPAMAEYLDQLDDLANQKMGLQIKLLEAQGKSEEALALSRQMELDAADESLHALMQQIWALEDAAKAERERTQALEEMRQTLQNNVAFAEQQLEQARKAEIERIELTVQKAEEAYEAELESINAQRNAYNEFINELQNKVSNAESALRDSMNAELSMYDEMISSAQANKNSQLSYINEITNARVKALNEELSIVSSVAKQFGQASKTVSAAEALSAARAGNFEPSRRIQTGGDYTNAIDARIGAAREAFALNEIGKLADARMTDLERTIAATESSADKQIAAIETASNNQVTKLESQKKSLIEQINAILGVDDSVLSLEEAIKQYNESQAALEEAINDGTLESLDAQEQIALEALEQAKDSAQEQITALNMQVDELLNIDNSVASVEEAIKLLMQERQALAEFEAENFSQGVEMQISAQTETTDAVKNVANVIGEMKDEIYDIIQTPPTKPVTGGQVDLRPDAGGDREWPPIVMEPFIDEIRALRKELNNANSQIGANTAKTANSLRKIEAVQLDSTVR